MDGYLFDASALSAYLNEEAITIGLDAASLPYEEALAARSGMLSEIQDATRALLLSLGAHL